MLRPDVQQALGLSAKKSHGSESSPPPPSSRHAASPVLAFQRPRELREFALVVDHLQGLDVMPDVAGAP